MERKSIYIEIIGCSPHTGYEEYIVSFKSVMNKDTISDLISKAKYSRIRVFLE